MSNVENLEKSEGIIKLKKMVDDCKFCFFCTNLSSHTGSTSTVMTAQDVDELGNIWFFSGLNSERNHDITIDNNVQLYFSCPEKNSYLSANGTAVIVLDKAKIKELWNPLLKIWFKDGADDRNISLIKVSVKNANYWDSAEGIMVNFFKMIATALTGIENSEPTSGKIKL